MPYVIESFANCSIATYASLIQAHFHLDQMKESLLRLEAMAESGRGLLRLEAMAESGRDKNEANNRRLAKSLDLKLDIC